MVSFLLIFFAHKASLLRTAPLVSAMTAYEQLTCCKRGAAHGWPKPWSFLSTFDLYICFPIHCSPLMRLLALRMSHISSPFYFSRASLFFSTFSLSFSFSLSLRCDHRWTATLLVVYGRWYRLYCIGLLEPLLLKGGP